MKQRIIALFLVLWAGVSGAQTTIKGGGGGVSSGSAVAGCTINSLVYIDASGNLACAGAAIGSGTTTLDNGAAAVSPFIVKDNNVAVLTVADGGATTFATQIIGPAGSVGTPSIRLDDADTGIYAFTSGWVSFTTNGVIRGSFTDTGLTFGPYYLQGGAALNSDDAYIGREAAATWQLGKDVNGAAVAQTLKAHDGITGTDVAGANLTLAGGRGTGAGTAGNFRIQTAIPVSTGTTAQILADRELFVAKNLAVADNTATTMFTITLGDDTDGGGIVDFCAMATSATTDRQKTCGQIAFSGIDVTAGAGGEACSAAITGTNSTAVSVGTLTVTAAATTGTDLCNIRITSDSSLNVAHTVRYSVRLHPSASTVVITPQ